MTHASMSPGARRRWLCNAGRLLAACALPATGRTAMQLRPTPAQTEGPFYPVAWEGDVDADLLAQGARRYAAGQGAWVQGAVTDTRGEPLAGALVEIWQCDAQGRYRHPGDGSRADADFQGFGRVVTDAQGGYRFHTLRPSPYPGRTPHIHFKVHGRGGRELLTTQLYVEGDEGNARDALWRRLSEVDRAALTRPFAQGPQGLTCHFPIVVEA